MRPDIEQLTWSRFAIGRESCVQRSHRRHQQRISHPPYRIGIRVTRVEDAKEEPSRWACSNQAYRNMPP